MEELKEIYDSEGEGSGEWQRNDVARDTLGR